MVVELVRDWQLKCSDMNKRAGQILEAELWTDCSFMVGSEQQTELKAHKLLLAMSSPVFEAMFYGPIAEQGNAIRVPDIEPELFKYMLKYIYSNDILINSIEFAIRMLFVADKYMLPELYNICIEYLSGNITPDSVCRVYELALMIDHENLTNECKKMIEAEPVKSLASPAFLDLNVNTVIKMFSLDMQIDSELILIQAAACYDKALKARQVDTDNSVPPAEKVKLQEIAVNGAGDAHIEKIGAAVELAKDLPGCSRETLGDNGVTGPGAESNAAEVVDKKKSPPVDRPILPVLQQIRFLTLTAQQLAEDQSLVSLLTGDEMAAIYNNIIAGFGKNTMNMPKGFTSSRTCSELVLPNSVNNANII